VESKVIGVDYGSSLVKWFDGKEFGTGIPKVGSISLGITSKGTLIKVSEYPLCKGKNLEQIIANEIEAETGISSKEFSVAYCPLEKVDSGCKLLVFVERKSHLESLENDVYEKARHVTVDVVGMISATHSIYGESFSGTVVDAGASKISVAKFTDGKVSSIEVIRAGFESMLGHEDLTARFKRIAGKEFVLIGGGALDDSLVEFLKGKGIRFEVPEISPFGELTPLYYNSYGLWRFRLSSCRADFKKFHFISSEILSRYKREITISLISLIVSLLLLTAGEYLRFSAAKQRYKALDAALKREISGAIGDGKVVAPKIQLNQEFEKLKKKVSFYLLDSPSLIGMVGSISSSVVKGVNVYSLSVSAVEETAKISGISESNNSLNEFRQKLIKYFKNVTISSSKKVKGGIKFTIEVQGVKVED
jgi:hypothetical protein